MDEASIINALQDGLKDYNVKTQIRRKGSQLHVLVTRDENTECDYDSLYSIVKRRIDELAIAGASELVVYGRLTGDRHPEWQKSAEIKLPLPLIELDLDELEDIRRERGDQAISITEDETLLQGNKPEVEFSNEYSSLKASLEEDLRAANGMVSQEEAFKLSNKENIQAALQEDLEEDLPENLSEEFSDEYKKLEEDLLTNFDSDLEEMDLDSLAIANDDGESFESISAAISNMQGAKASQDAEFDLHSPDFNSFSVVTLDPASLKSPEQVAVPSVEIISDDFSISAPTVANYYVPMPPPPPTRRKVTDKAEQVAQNNSQKNDKINDSRPKRIKLANPIRINTVSLAVGMVMVSVLGICAWLVWDRSVQQRYLADARDLENLSLDPQKIKIPSVLADTRNKIQSAIAQLELIPDRPASLYSEAQVEIKNLKPKLVAFDRRVTIEYAANSNLELAKKSTLDAALMVQSPPHTSEVWKSAQAKRQEAIKALESIDPESSMYAQAQTRLKTYRAELVQIGKWVDIQVRAESIAGDIRPAIATQIQQLKSDPSGKENFLKRCSTILQPEISSTEAQRLGLTVNNLTGYLCAYYWDL
ncbi:MAG: hypothetical protein AUK48_05010 [Oscillatoriales cyanobacterium CG2_30_44_21]|nr:MAG: hypothetical protein AUK48_05010 [Oscillatoriales cyanobacterium CG2_30_44_21]